MAFIAAALPLLQAVGSIASVGGTIMSGISAQNQAEYQGAVARNNAINERNKALYQQKVGEGQAERQGLKNAARSGAILAKQGASGVEVGTGSYEDVIAGDAVAGRLDTETIVSNSNLAQWGYRSRAANYDNAAAMADSAAEMAPWSTALNAGGSLLSNAKSISDGFSWVGSSLNSGSGDPLDIRPGGGWS